METIDGSYNLILVALSFIISVLGSYTALQLVRQVTRAAEPDAADDQLFWIGSAAFAMGAVGIWSMHFIGMVAFTLGVNVTYHVGLTVLSLLIAVAVTGVGFFLVAKDPSSWKRIVTGGTFAGLGVAGMHYTGMAAMRLPATMTYSTGLVAASVVIAIIAATAALWLAFNFNQGWRKVGGAVVMGIAVCGMHYTAMAAANFTRGGEGASFRPTILGGAGLAYGVFALSVLIVSIQIGLSVGMQRDEEVDTFEV